MCFGELIILDTFAIFFGFSQSYNLMFFVRNVSGNLFKVVLSQ